MNRPIARNGGSFNLLYGRPKTGVRKEVEALIQKHNLAWLVTQEAGDYALQLDAIKGFSYFTGSGHRGTKANGILVRDDVRVTKFREIPLGDGWKTVEGKHHLPTSQVQLCIDDWLMLRGDHLMTPSFWPMGKLEMAKERKDDYLAHMRSNKAFLRPPRTRYAALISADWNENPETRGQWSPRWLANTTDSTVFCPRQRAGHGRIDYSIGKGLTIGRTFKDLEIREGSDHEPVVHLNVRKKVA